MPIAGDAILAPMHHVSDWPFRSLCSQLGSAMSYTELVKAEFIVSAFEHMLPRLKYEEAERPMVFQLYGDDPDELLEAALRVQELSPDIIDINMGCPAESVAKDGGGGQFDAHPVEGGANFQQTERRPQRAGDRENSPGLGRQPQLPADCAHHRRERRRRHRGPWAHRKNSSTAGRPTGMRLPK